MWSDLSTEEQKKIFLQNEYQIETNRWSEEEQAVSLHLVWKDTVGDGYTKTYTVKYTL